MAVSTSTFAAPVTVFSEATGAGAAPAPAGEVMVTGKNNT